MSGTSRPRTQRSSFALIEQKQQLTIRRNLKSAAGGGNRPGAGGGNPPTVAELEAASRTRQLAFFECVRRVGECAAQIDSLDAEWLGSQFPMIPWRDVKATRNRLTHRYWSVDYGILHGIASAHLPMVTKVVSSHLGTSDP